MPLDDPDKKGTVYKSRFPRNDRKLRNNRHILAPLAPSRKGDLDHHSKEPAPHLSIPRQKARLVPDSQVCFSRAYSLRAISISSLDEITSTRGTRRNADSSISVDS